jgi:DNA polymerase-1
MIQIDDLIDTVCEVDPGEHDVKRINSIKDLYPTERQDSKVPTFLLTYGGTYIGMMAQCDFDKPAAQSIEHRYHQLYKVSDEWVAEKLQLATKDGYVTAAFGLRVRTPLLKQSILGNRATTWEAEAEGRTAGNALGQSWCLLNTRAHMAFMQKVRKHPKYRTLVRPTAHIHDAGYYLIPDDIDVLLYVNKELVKEVQWQNHPDIAHDTVHLGGELSIFYPNWASEITIPNGASAEEVLQTVAKKLNK